MSTFYSTVYKGETLIWSDALSYSNKRTVLNARDTEGYPFLTASVNLPDQDMDSNEMAIKDYSENSGILDHLFINGIVSHPVRFVEIGNTEIAIVRYLGIKHLKTIEL